MTNLLSLIKEQYNQFSHLSDINFIIFWYGMFEFIHYKLIISYYIYNIQKEKIWLNYSILFILSFYSFLYFLLKETFAVRYFSNLFKFWALFFLLWTQFFIFRCLLNKLWNSHKVNTCNETLIIWRKLLRRDKFRNRLSIYKGVLSFIPD